MAINPADLPLLDAFGGAGLAAGWSANEVDTDDSGLPTVSGGQALSPSGGRSAYWNTTYSRACGVRVKVPTLPTGPMYLWLATVVATASPSGYRLRFDPVGSLDYQMSSVAAGAATFLDGEDISVFAFSAGDELAMTLDTDGTLKGWRFHSGAWAEVASVVNTTYTSAFYPGVSIFDTTVRLDDFRGGNPTTSTVESAGVGGGVGGGTSPQRARVAVSPGGAVGGGTVPNDAAPPLEPREVQFYAPHDLSATIRVRRYETQGVRVAYKLGRITSKPATPTSSGFAVAATQGVSASEIVTVSVPLPTNSDDYTLAVFGWDGSAASTDCLLLEVFADKSPTHLSAGIDWAAATIETDRPGSPYLTTAAAVAGGALVPPIATYDDGPTWRVLTAGEDPSDPHAGVPIGNEGWEAGSSGKIVRVPLPTATASRWHRWQNRLRPTP